MQLLKWLGISKKSTTTVLYESPKKVWHCKNFNDAMRGKKPRKKGCEETCGCSFEYKTESQLRKEASEL